MSKHTPGPWRLNDGDAQGPNMVMHPTLHGVAIAVCTEVFRPINGIHDPSTAMSEPCPENKLYGTTHRGERVANVRLISAAPELLEALKRFIAYGNVFGYQEWEENPYDQAMAAIAKAEGMEEKATDGEAEE